MTNFLTGGGLKSLLFLQLFVLSLGCKPDETKEVGRVNECSNGSYFSLEDGSCQLLSGHSLLHDSLGFERVEVDNGLTVPRVVNGLTPFSVSFSYDVNRRAAFDVVVKRVEYGEVLGDNYTYWEKVWVEPGQGRAKVRLYPKDGKPMPAGKANNFIEGSWRSDVGFIVEVKGGDRFEDDDGDALKLWRVAGLEIDPEVADDPEAKSLILGDLKVAETFVSCGQVEGSLDVIKNEENLRLVFGLKDPGNEWRSWGEQTLDLPQGYQGVLPFAFKAQDGAGACPPAGGPISVDPWKAEPGQYVLQLDIYNSKGEQIKFDNSLYQAARSAVGVAILDEPELPLTESEAAAPVVVPESGPPLLLFELGRLEFPETVKSCAPLRVKLEVVQSRIDLSLSLALKQPGDNWLNWGSQTVTVPSSLESQLLTFEFPSKDEKGRCAPPGEAVRDDPGRAAAGQYLIQLDIFDQEGKKYDNAEAEDYRFVQNWAGIKVLKK